MGALDENPQILRIRQHLVEHLGAPEEVFEVTGSPLPKSPVQALNFAYFAPQGPQAPVVFVTCGASLFTMKDGRRLEGLVILKGEPDPAGFESLQRLLGSFALFAESNDEVIQLSDVLHAPKELTAFCAMDSIIFMPPVPFVPEFHRVTFVDEPDVELYWLLPVYETEAEYAMEHGPQALMMVFAAQGLDLTDPQRAEANTLISPEDAESMAKNAFEKHQARAGDQQTTAAPRQTQVKMKSSKRDIGRGSFDVATEGGKVRISRRGSKKKTAAPSKKPGAAAPAARPSSAPGPRPGAPKKGRSLRPGEVRFDLASEGNAAIKRPAQPPEEVDDRTKTKPETAMTDEERAEAKKERIAALKRQARATADRAARVKKKDP